MFSTLKRFLFPKLCLYCREIHPSKYLLCDRCLVGLELIYPKNRCSTCFYECPYGKCKGCTKTPTPWYKAGSVFPLGSSGVVLLFDPDLFAKEIAAFFIIQYITLRWQIPDAFYIDTSLKQISPYIQKFLPLKKVNKRKEYAGKKVLYLTKNADETIVPKFLLGARIYLLAFQHNGD